MMEAPLDGGGGGHSWKNSNNSWMSVDEEEVEEDNVADGEVEDEEDNDIELIVQASLALLFLRFFFNHYIETGQIDRRRGEGPDEEFAVLCRHLREHLGGRGHDGAAEAGRLSAGRGGGGGGGGAHAQRVLRHHADGRRLLRVGRAQSGGAGRRNAFFCHEIEQ